MSDVLDAEGFVADARTTIKTFTGKYIDPWTMVPGDVCIEDVAHSNSQACRFNGHTASFWSVAQHELLVAKLLQVAGFESHALAGLIHDGGEAYALDLPAPIKNHPNLTAYKAMEERCGDMVALALDVDIPFDPIVKAADVFARRVEQLAFCGSTSDPDTFDQRFNFHVARSFIQAIAFQGPSIIEQIFLEAFRALNGKGKKVELWTPS